MPDSKFHFVTLQNDGRVRTIVGFSHKPSNDDVPIGAHEITKEQFDEISKNLAATYFKDGVFVTDYSQIGYDIPKTIFIRRLHAAGLLQAWTETIKVGVDVSELSQEEFLFRELWNHETTVKGNDQTVRSILAKIASEEETNAALAPV